ncbi:putative membrane protein [Paraburkholderia sp. GAS199]|uniref:hypothetical protein n=1 Tax=Paraburkholderia sp. GAS199 TaxID=3035126 RepID=UPI003D247188
MLDYKRRSAMGDFWFFGVLPGRGQVCFFVLFFWGFCLPAAVGFFVCLRAAFFLCVIGLLVLPLCGAALTFFAAAKKAKQRKPLTPLTLSGHLS